MKTKLVDMKSFKLHVPEDDFYFSNPAILQQYCQEVDQVYSLAWKYIPHMDRGAMLDIGACMGVSCIPALKKDWTTFVYAFEPHPDNFSLLKKNVEANHIDGLCELIPMAVLDRDDYYPRRMRRGAQNITKHNSGAWMMDMGEHGVKDQFSDAVKVCSLDGFLLDKVKRKIGMIWADCQGAEPLIMKGAKSIDISVPWYIEVEIPLLENLGTKDMLMDQVIGRFNFFLDMRGDMMPQKVKEIHKLYATIRDRGHKQTNILLWR